MKKDGGDALTAGAWHLLDKKQHWDPLNTWEEAVVAANDGLSEGKREIDIVLDDNGNEVEPPTLWKKKKLTKWNFEMAEKACGLSYNPRGLLWDRRLRRICPPAEFVLEDWSHVYLCKGIGGDEIWCLLSRIKQREGKELYARLREEVCAWRWPYFRSSQCKNTWQIFSDARAESNRSANGWKSSSSEFLSVAPILLNWVSTHFGRSLPGEVESFRRLYAIIDYILALKYGRAADANHLGNLIDAHFRQHVLVYGDGLIGPKWHRALHLP